MFNDPFLRNLKDLLKVNRNFLLVLSIVITMGTFYVWMGLENQKRANAAFEHNKALGLPINVSSGWQGYTVEVAPNVGFAPKAPSVGVAPKADIPPVPAPGPLD